MGDGGFQPLRGAAGIAPAAYCDPAVFDAELSAIFERSWIFVGFTDDLAEPDRYLTARIGRHDVLVQNFDGELRAFRNVCSHRFSLIHRAPRGRGMLRCLFHGWTYDRDGVPYGVPANDAAFGLDHQGRCARALTRYALAVCGRFVFVRIAAEGPALDEHLGPYAEVLRHASAVFLHRFEDREEPWRANWKMGVESVLEVYHADTVHPETFRKLIKRDWRCAYAGRNSRGTVSMSDKSAQWWDGVSKRLGFRPSAELRDYDHLHVFPNLELGLTRGAVMSVQTYEPVEAGRCRLRLSLWLADRPERDGAARRAVEASAMQLNAALLAEDRDAAEAAHLGVQQVAFPALLGANEERIQHFHREWRTMMDAASRTGAG